MTYLKIKTSLVAILTLVSVTVMAQKNVFLDQAFWRTNPTVDQVKAEIAKGNSPSELNSNSFDAVVMAINAGATNESIKFLLTQPGNDVNKLTHDGRTYIFWSASRGNVELMEYLLSKGAKLTIKDSNGSTPLNFAASGGQQNTKVYDLLIANGADLKKDLSSQGANALLLTIPSAKDFTLVDYFVAKGLSLNSVDAKGNTAFNYAARAGNIELLKTLVSKGVKFNDNAMLMATQGGRGATANTLELFQYLESLKINPAVIGPNGENVLHSIARKPKQEEIIKYFISKGVDINKADKDGNTPIINAAASNTDLQLLTYLSTLVKNINQANVKGETALTMAVRGNTADAVSLLLSKGADINVVDAAGDNLVAYLIQGYNPQRGTELFEAKLKLLQDKGVDFAKAQKNGNTLYHLVLAKEDFTLLKRIESFKADVNAKNKEGITALHKAAMTAKDDSVMKYLISLGAKKDATTEFKETAFDLAKENEYLSKNKIAIDFLK
ncbi:ankyrin repeat domain-containing protein [Pedobacter frigiditerrae]|uniref:ankyrin repeat domain-containing protein n=1 Tax=Pedobacter frigiditerrae TaxID=2530452 RepID=UPI0029318BD1|nr:ankyrin repeat domain-containing protein [Pedobacter frigiditerrae]